MESLVDGERYSMRYEKACRGRVGEVGYTGDMFLLHLVSIVVI